MKRTIAILCLLGLALASCGGGSEPRGGNRPGTSPGASSPGGTGGGSGSPSPSAGSSPGGGTASPKPSGSVTPDTPPPSGISVTLDRKCVRRGDRDDPQGLTVRTSPGGPVGYVTAYSDGSSIVDHPDYGDPWGGQGGGFADSAGTFRAAWTVPPTAPTGKATVTVNVGVPNPPKLTFTVVGIGQPCP